MESLFSPVVLFFVLGALAAFARSDLALPEALSKALSLYLMAAIGLKGGVQVADAGFTADLAFAALAGLGFSFVIPIAAFLLLRSFGRLSSINAAAVAAHYGSVSVVTYVAGSELLAATGNAPAGYMVAVLALMETPAIIVGLWLARGGLFGRRDDMLAVDTGQADSGLLHETLLNGSVVLLTGSFAIGLIIGKDGFSPIAPVFQIGFNGLLCLFLLDMGLVAARRLMDTRSITWRLVLLGIAFPIVNGTLGCLVGTTIGLDIGTTTALAILAASASYIAVPAAMRMALPQADAGLYLAMSLAVTFPFNIVLGIPLYSWIATTLAS